MTCTMCPLCQNDPKNLCITTLSLGCIDFIIVAQLGLGRKWVHLGETWWEK